jgi:hypothetical protein
MHIMHIMIILYIGYITLIFDILSMTGWLDRIGSKVVYERRENKQVLYVVPVSSILGRLPLVPVGDTGTIPFSMTAEYPGASCDTRPDAGDGSRLWYVNTWALSWAPKP